MTLLPAPGAERPAGRDHSRLGRTVRALTCRNYRLFFLGGLVSTIGTWIQIGAQSWLVLRLTDSGLAVGLLLALQFLPILVAGPWGGVVADRCDKRRVLLGTQVASIALAGSLALVTFLGLAGVWMVLLVASRCCPRRSSRARIGRCLSVNLPSRP